MKRISKWTGKRLPSKKTLENRLERLKLSTAKKIEVLLRQIREHRE